MKIHDKKLIFLIKRILKAPIRLEDGTTVTPDKGTPQGGIISPLLANIVLNELGPLGRESMAMVSYMQEERQTRKWLPAGKEIQSERDVHCPLC